MSDAAIKVLFIVGFGRSGTTLIDNILGQIDGFFSLGELVYVWDRCLRDNRLCGCGEPFAECPEWTPIVARAASDLSGADLDRLIAARESLTPGGVITRSRFGRRPLSGAGARELIERHVGFYRAVRERTGCRVLVDSSKLPGFGYALKQHPDVEPTFVHVVRDSRPVAYSWRKKKVYDPSGEKPMYMSRFSLAASCRLWLKWNLATEVLCSRPRERYLRLRYEDFADHPRRAVERLVEAVGEGGAELPFESSHEVRMAANHSVGGNPSRFQSGTVTVRRDEAWRERLSRGQRLAVTALTWPLLLRYGYPKKI